MVRLPRILGAIFGFAAVLMLAAGCADRGPTEVELRPEGLRVGGVAQALIAPIGYRGGIYSRVIDQNGGVLYFGTGSLSFPPRALAQPTRITATVDGLTVGATFGPHGLTFPATARPVLKFNSGHTLLGMRPPQIAYVGHDNLVLELLPTDLDASGIHASASLRHFSPYILAQNYRPPSVAGLSQGRGGGG